MPVKSPCTGVCVLDTKTGYCAGCFRTGDEIGSWMGLSDGGKKRILAQINKRRAQQKQPEKQPPVTTQPQ
ncbi:DUF1289 domain-containing protein [Thalassospira lucentensis]|uniref:DUF1289 domain-containing protein n=1 Tax=Thalassospira lucentensis TaxID=168935 RepID=A0A358HP69_9PROT|nr:DUF1289 domain-containing protein [Thalassospira lucentensis]HBU96950.1 DUF1289 domain-containing protein [Thalassospira lucentensis]HCW69485.1 DUF1289 domain-containing protein [Thalassospira lucentensis]|tara:strand:+ start:1139 stop:1348 length:210 start_codon:yes stop_codon:yes gene_type:complete